MKSIELASSVALVVVTVVVVAVKRTPNAFVWA